MIRKSLRTQAGFTLMELLVVIAIIGTLFSIMAPAVQKVHKQTLTAACVNNQKQIGTALHLYRTDFDQKFPPAEVDGEDAYWFGKKVGTNYDTRKGPLGRYIPDSRLLQCPVLDQPSDITELTNSGGYGYNKEFVGNGASGGTGPVAGSNVQSDTIILADNATISGSNAVPYPFLLPPKTKQGVTNVPSIHFRHEGQRAVVLWRDGRVTMEKPGFFRDAPTAPYQKNNIGFVGETDDNKFYDGKGGNASE